MCESQCKHTADKGPRGAGCLRKAAFRQTHLTWMLTAEQQFSKLGRGKERSGQRVMQSETYSRPVLFKPRFRKSNLRSHTGVSKAACSPRSICPLLLFAPVLTHIYPSGAPPQTWESASACRSIPRDSCSHPSLRRAPWDKKNLCFPQQVPRERDCD